MSEYRDGGLAPNGLREGLGAVYRVFRELVVAINKI